MNYPVTYSDIAKITGANAMMPANASISSVVPKRESTIKTVLEKANAIDSKIKVHVATGGELQKAINKRLNVQSELGPYNSSTTGFYLAMDEASYNRMIELREYYENGSQRTTSGSEVFENIDNSYH